MSHGTVTPAAPPATGGRPGVPGLAVRTRQDPEPAAVFGDRAACHLMARALQPFAKFGVGEGPALRGDDVPELRPDAK